MSTLRIDIESTQCSPCSYLFNQKRILIGRSPRSQVCIPDLRVSLEHLQIVWTEDGDLEILDTYSKSGVWGGTTHLKPGQAYTAHHQVMVRFLEYRISISISPLSLAESSEEDRLYQTNRLAQSKSGWLLIQSYQESKKQWILPLHTSDQWSDQEDHIFNFTSNLQGIQVEYQTKKILIHPHLPWQSLWGEWSIFPLGSVGQSSLSTPQVTSLEYALFQDSVNQNLGKPSKGIVWIAIGILGFLSGIGGWIYFLE